MTPAIVKTVKNSSSKSDKATRPCGSRAAASPAAVRAHDLMQRAGGADHRADRPQAVEDQGEAVGVRPHRWCSWSGRCGHDFRRQLRLSNGQVEPHQARDNGPTPEVAAIERLRPGSHRCAMEPDLLGVAGRVAMDGGGAIAGGAAQAAGLDHDGDAIGSADRMLQDERVLRHLGGSDLTPGSPACWAGLR